MAMASSTPSLCLYIPVLVIAVSLILTSLRNVEAASLLEHERERQVGRRSEAGGRRLLLSFRETPGGGNATFECSPSGPCVPCLYSEKNDEKYHCSETGYRIPLKCVETKDSSQKENGKKSQKSRSVLENLHELAIALSHRRLLDDSSTLEGRRQAYITYRSCIPAVNEEKLSVLGFEGIMLCLLMVSSSVFYFRRKRTFAMSGVGAARTQTNSRF
ncbi:PREDICTED: uncharacterized protein LOC104608011 [Nelumbo nucifera]|uniref:Structural polyprotein n=2 Tax=Nelumbo nucifera TaxID=4432 RepID=A0A822YEZ7_NELNU|nr:PREDICTED: uncharacterized protein LOC104608011 [Nelumbo nucifera]DAD31100.1 TPA_asm: hypothetical protein HUJ06_009951 [Nelumbo nucifera]